MKNIPRIRFKGFSGEWEEKSLDEISSVIFDGTHQTPIYTDSGIPFFSVENLISKSKNKFISNKDYIEATKKNKPEKNDILITRIGNIGFSRVVTWDYAFSIYVTLAVVKQSNMFNSFYLNHYIQSAKYQAEIMSKSLLNAIPCKINMNELRNTNIVLPPDLNEQTKIGNYFQNLDKLIEQKEKKYQKLHQFKKAMLSKMFPKNGATTPEIRFRGFGGEWEEKRLGEVAEIIMGQSPRSTSYNSDKNGIPLIQGNADIQNRLSNPRNWTTEKTKECKIGDLILTVRAPVGAIAKSLHEACIGRGVCAIRNNAESTPEFIYQFLLNYETKWSILEQGSTFTAVSGAEIRKLNIKTSSVAEQTKIGNYFQKLDSLIDLHHQELQKLRNIKKASLAKMFV